MIEKKIKQQSRFPRGFRTWCENVSLQYRKEMNLEPVDPIDAWALAKKLNVTVLRAQEVPGIARETLDVLIKEDPESWSAATLCFGGAYMIILNPMNSIGRTNSDLTHELAHILIGHDAARIDITPDHMLMLQNYDMQQEAEADWLAGCLLLPRTALLHLRKKGMEKTDAIRIYGVSRAMFDYRIGTTGVDRQISRMRTIKTSR